MGETCALLSALPATFMLLGINQSISQLEAQRRGRCSGEAALSRAGRWVINGCKAPCEPPRFSLAPSPPQQLAELPEILPIDTHTRRSGSAIRIRRLPLFP